MITMINGDILDTDAPLIIHGCNAQGVMGAGVAKVLYDRWPVVKTAYISWYSKTYRESEMHLPLGANQLVPVDPNKIVVNSITQLHYGRDGKKYVSYDAVDRAMRNLKFSCQKRNITTIAMPMIGTGLGGGNWDVIRAIVETHLNQLEVKVYYL